MFLTNNYDTINNLMIYSNGNLILKIIPKYTERKEHYGWISILQRKWKIFLKTKTPNEQVDYTTMPYGNMGRRIRLMSSNKGELVLKEQGGTKDVFNE